MEILKNILSILALPIFLGVVGLIGYALRRLTNPAMPKEEASEKATDDGPYLFMIIVIVGFIIAFIGTLYNRYN